MENVTTFEKFKEAVQKQTYYECLYSIIESILNIKVIVFNEECYDSGGSVIQCGVTNDKKV